MERLVTLGEVLSTAEEWPIDSALFLPSDRDWDIDTRAAALILDDDENDEPIFAAQHGLVRTLGAYQVQDIVANAREQISKPSVSNWLQP